MRRWIKLSLLSLAAFGFSGGLAAAADTRFPVRLSSNGRHLVDRAGAPFFVHGDTAWSLLVGLNQDKTERYLEDRRQRGFNALIVNLLEHKARPSAIRRPMISPPPGTMGPA